ncbi:hypothetical protein ACROYT_G014894 [Oculina patagonica]
MNHYFISVGKVLAKPFRNISTIPITSTPPCEFHLNSVTVNFVQNALRSLKKSKAVGHLLPFKLSLAIWKLRWWRSQSITQRGFNGKGINLAVDEWRKAVMKTLVERGHIFQLGILHTNLTINVEDQLAPCLYEGKALKNLPFQGVRATL